MIRKSYMIMLNIFCLILAACSPPVTPSTVPSNTSVRLTSTIRSTPTPDAVQMRATQTQSALMQRTRVALAARAIEQTAQAQETIQALTPSPTRVTPTATATIDYSPYLDAWSIYTNEQYGFSFEYKSIWDLPPFNSCGIVEDTRDLPTRITIFQLWLGARGKFGVIPANGLYRVAFVDQWIQDNTDPGYWELNQRENTFINGLGATFISYNWAGGRYGETYFFYANDYIYFFDFTGGAFCEFPEVGLHETGLYWHAVNTFSLFTPTP